MASDDGRPPRGDGDGDVDGVAEADPNDRGDGSPPILRPDPSSGPPRGPETPPTPTTPASRAEHMFQQRKEKLARSLDKVNRILERSRATRGAAARFDALKEEEEASDVAGREADGPAVSGGGDARRARMADSGVVEEDGADDSDKKDAASPASVENLMAQLRVDKEQYLQAAAEFDDSRDEESLATAKSVKSRLKKDLRVDTGREGDHAIRQSELEKETRDDESFHDGSAVYRPKAELQVDSGEAFSSSLALRESRALQRSDVQQPQERKKKGAVSKDTNVSNFRLPAIDSTKTVPVANNDFADIFRTFNSKPQGGAGEATPPLIEFGTHMIAQSLSSDSSLTGDRDDTMFLIKPSFDLASTDSKENDGRLAQLRRGKFRDYKIREARTRGPLSSSEKPWRQRAGGRRPHGSEEPQQEHCPQFLPSLNYSTLRESNEFAGLVPQNEDPSPTWGAGRGAPNLVQRMRKPRRKPMASIGGGAFTRFSQSFDELATAGGEKEQQCWNSVFDLDGDLGEEESPAQPAPGRQEGALPRVHSPRGPTYDFCAHSCSMSENEDDEQLIGRPEAGRVKGGPGRSLVTHRTGRFHKKILNRFRGIKKGRKSTV